ncbi:accessory factor associated with RNA polymerase II [Hypoxylon texense]
MSSLSSYEDVDQEASLRLSLDSEELGRSNNDNDSDSEDGNASVAGAAQPQKVTRKVLDNLQFSQFLRDHQEKIYTSLSSQAIKDQDKSMNLLVQEAESEKIISSPREYQTELFERAKEKNIIAVLDTGTGKTLIAALLLRHIVEQELEDRYAGKPHRVDKVALVFQQYEVLKTNLDHPVQRFHGDLGGGTLTHDFWKQKLEESMVVVCTADILLTCLHYSFVKMEQINLLIFDEAHHTKKNHPYARIIKDFYASLEEKEQMRPRVLGMTASPVDSKTDVTTAAAKLEGLLHCEIVTVADASVFTKSSLNRPVEDFLEYSVPPEPFETPLWQKLYKLVGHNEVFNRLFTYSRDCTAELGRWCADRVWKMCLTEQEAQKMEAKTEMNFVSGKVHLPVSALDAERSAVREAYEMVAAHKLPEPRRDLFHLSGKVESLITALQEHLDSDHNKCIIFVEQRLTAMLLADLMKQPTIGMLQIKFGTLLGAASSSLKETGMSLREQFVTMHRFRNDDLNCIFATSVGEEGIDIPDCNIIIRFNLCKTVIQYIQSRGRARRKDSKFFHMVEFANHGQLQSVFDNEDSEARLRNFYNTLSEDRLLTGSDFNIDYFLSKEKSHRTYIVPSTRAKLTYKMSLAILASFVSTLPRPVDAVYTADYVVRHVGREFECEVILPDTSPVKSVIGRRAASKQVAKCSAAFEMCLLLRKKKYLDEYLQSTFAKHLPSMRNAHLAISSKKRAEYPMRTKPSIWDNRGIPTQLFLTVLKMSSPEVLDRSSRPLAILTRHPLPQIPKFPLFFSRQRTSDVEFVPLQYAIDVTLEEVELLNNFTLKIFDDIFSKEYRSDLENMPYFVAPLQHTHSFDFASAANDTRTLMDWDCLSELQDTTRSLEWENQPDDFFEDRFVIDPHDGSRKFYTVRRRHDLKPTDPEPPGVPKGQTKRKARQNTQSDIWNYSISLWAKARSRLAVRLDLPVVEAEFIPIRRNMLDELDETHDIERKCFLVFQTLKVSPLRVDVVAMAYNLPAIIYRLETCLIVLDACKSLSLNIRPDFALEAMTKDSDNTEEHSEEQINLQRGMGKNYERLEFLGDSFLKMSTTIALFSRIPDANEFQYHVDRMLLICNKNLFNNALDLKLEESIRSKGFNRRIWYPDGLELLRGKKNTSILGKKGVGRGVHSLADKSIADVCEALIGASYLTTYENNNFDLAIQAVTKFVNHSNHRMMNYGDYYAEYQIPEWQSAESTAVQREVARQVEKKLGYKFKYPRLLRSAFMHPSFGTIYERIPNYQRLEFLGDSLLDMVCVDFLFHRYPSADPQWLTEHKMAMVSNQFLGCLCVSLGLQTHMLSMTSALHREITEYVAAITTARAAAEEEAESANLDRASYARNFWVEVQKPPKALPDIVESYVGALFVDSAFDYGQVQRFFRTHVQPYFEDMHIYDTFANRHPVTFLANMLQLHFHCANWRLLIQEIAAVEDAPLLVGQKQVLCGVMIHGEVREHATAASGRYAKIAAAKKIMNDLQTMSVEEYKHKFGCHCSPEEAQASDPLAHITAV